MKTGNYLMAVAFAAGAATASLRELKEYATLVPRANIAPETPHERARQQSDSGWAALIMGTASLATAYGCWRYRPREEG